MFTTRADWANLLFTDEVRVKLQGADGRILIYRRTGERNSKKSVVPVDWYNAVDRSIIAYQGTACIYPRKPERETIPE